MYSQKALREVVGGGATAAVGVPMGFGASSMVKTLATSLQTPTFTSSGGQGVVGTWETTLFRNVAGHKKEGEDSEIVGLGKTRGGGHSIREVILKCVILDNNGCSVCNRSLMDLLDQTVGQTCTLSLQGGGKY